MDNYGGTQTDLKIAHFKHISCVNVFQCRLVINLLHFQVTLMQFIKCRTHIIWVTRGWYSLTKHFEIAIWIFFTRRSPASFCWFSPFQTNIKIFTTNKCQIISIQCTLLGFESTTFGTWVSSLNHKTRASTHLVILFVYKQNLSGVYWFVDYRIYLPTVSTYLLYLLTYHVYLTTIST